MRKSMMIGVATVAGAGAIGYLLLTRPFGMQRRAATLQPPRYKRKRRREGPEPAHKASRAGSAGLIGDCSIRSC